MPTYKGRGARAKYGQRIRPLARQRDHQQSAATPAEASGTFTYQGRTIRSEAWHNLVTVKTKVNPENPTFALFVFYDPFYKRPLVLATTMALAAENIYLV